MFPHVEFIINGKVVSGIPAIILIASPFLACIALGIMIGASL